jgi:HAD superfamily hydrolase (TIGR01549 family)
MKSIRPKYVFFDVANTLLYKPGLFNSISSVLNNNGIHVALDLIRKRHKLLSEIIKFPNKTSKNFYDYFNRELLLALGVIPENKIIDEIYLACSYLDWRTFDDIKYLGDIKIPIGIISNWDSSLMDKLNKYIPFEFDRIISSSGARKQKPDGLIFDEATRGIACDLEQILYVGDSIQMDYLGARHAGLTPILIDRDYVYPNFNGPIIRTLESLIVFIG